MQADNYNYKPDEQFTNRGWDEMRKKLDKEMPVERKKRKAIIWFYFLGTLLLASAILVFNYYKSPITPVNEEQRIYAEEENKNLDDNQNQNVNQNQKIKNIKDENTLTINKGLKTESEVNQLPFKVRNEKSTKTKGYNNNNLQRASNDLISDISKVSGNRIISEPVVENSEIGSTKSANNQIGLVENITKREPITLNSISFLDFLLEEKERQIAMIDEENLEKNKAAKTIITKPEKSSEKRTIEFGVNAGALLDMENNHKIGGFASSFVHFPIGKKLGIRSGLGYSLINKDLNYRYSDVQSAGYLDPNNVASGSQELLSYIDINTYAFFNLVRFHYLETPLLITYTPSKKWQFQAGGNLSYLLKDKLQLIDSGFDFTNSDDATNLGVELGILKSESIDLEEFQKQDYWNKWNMNAVLGVAFNLNSKLKIELQYHRSFSRFLDTNEAGIYQDERSFVDPNQNINPTTGGFSNVVYSVQNFQSEAINDSSSPSELNLNHSLRLGFSYRFK